MLAAMMGLAFTSPAAPATSPAAPATSPTAPATSPIARGPWINLGRLPFRALEHAPRPMNVALASWYDDSGTTASGIHYTYGYASLMFGSDWGRATLFCHAGRCATGRLDDHGPYVSGRLFDLDAALKGALGCPDLCWVAWR